MSFSSNKVKPNNISIDGSQTISNKVLDASNDFSGDIIDPARSDVKKGTQAELETYALSATNGQLCFATDTKLMYQVLDSALVSVGSGSAAINYIANPDLNIDASDITGDTNLVISHETVAPLRGAGSLKISKGAIDASTQSVLIDMNPVDTADLAKKLTISFDIDASNVNYKDGDAQVRIIKDPLGTPVTIRVNGEDIKGGKNTHIAQFQTDHTEVDYALEIYWADTGVLASELILDNIQVGPREVVKGAAMTDWKSYTPSNTQGFGTVTSPDFKYRRVGDSIEINALWTSGTVTAVEPQIALPDGLVIDSTKMSTKKMVGSYERNLANETILLYTVLATGGDSFVNFGRKLGTSNPYDVITTAAAMAATSEIVFFTALVPIQGWSSNAVSSEDLGGREIVVEARNTSTQALTANVTDITAPTISSDTTNSFSSGVFTAPESGYYVSILGHNATTVSGKTLYTYVDGVLDKEVSGNNTTFYQRDTTITYLEKGQTLSYRSNVTVTVSNVKIEIAKLASPQTILQTETVAARYTSSNGQSVVANVFTDMKYEDIVYDTHNTYDTSTGEYTVPVSGYYNISAKLTWTTSSSDQTRIINMLLNGVTISKADLVSTFNNTIHLSEGIYLEKDDVLKIQAYTEITTRSLNTALGYNIFSIARIK